MSPGRKELTTVLMKRGRCSSFEAHKASWSVCECWVGIQEEPLADLKEDNGSFGTFQKLKKIQA